MTVNLKIIELENLKSEVQVIVDDKRPITWKAEVIKGEEKEMKINGETKTVYSMNLVQQPLLYLLAERFTNLEDVEDEKADINALKEAFTPDAFYQLLNFVNFTETVSQMMQYNNLIVDNPRTHINDIAKN